MKVIVSKNLNLVAHVEDFRIKFEARPKRNEKKIWWFTPSGSTLKIWLGGLHLDCVGRATFDNVTRLLKELTSNKTTIFYNIENNKYYTIITDGDVVEIDNMANILFNAKKELELNRSV